MRIILVALFFNLFSVVCICQSSENEYSGTTFELAFFDGEKVVNVTPEGKDVYFSFDPLIKKIVISYTGIDGGWYVIKCVCTNSFGDRLQYVDDSGFLFSVPKSFLVDAEKKGVLIILGDKIVQDRFISALVIKDFKRIK